MNTHRSKSMSEIPDVEYEYAITIGYGYEFPYVKAKQRRDWAIPDPKAMNEQGFNTVRDTIETKVLSLIDSINGEK